MSNLAGLLLATLLTTLSGYLSPKGFLTLFLTLNVTNVDHRNWCGVFCVPCGASVLPNVGFVVYMDFAGNPPSCHGAEKAGDAEVDNKTLT